MEEEIKILIKVYNDLLENQSSLKDYDIIYAMRENIKNIIRIFAETINCPINWRDIGGKMYKEFENDNIIVEDLQLYDYSEED